MESKPVTYKDDKELEEIWMNGFQKWMDESRKSVSVNSEYEKQQAIYTEFATLYDEALRVEACMGPVKISEKINQLFAENKEVKILDFGCGTGLVADNLKKFGFLNIDGVDCNQGMLDVAAGKNVMSKLILGKSAEGLKDISSDSYDMVCSAGVFFLSSSHPGTDCFKELCRITKKGGTLIILTKSSYLNEPYVNLETISKLEKEGVLTICPKELFEGYRKPFEFEADPKSMGAILRYKVL